MYSEEKSADNELLPKTFTDFSGKQVEVNWPKGQLLCKVGDVRLFLISEGRYAIVYGLEVKSNLKYHEAAQELGYCVMHNMACDYGIH